MDYNNINCKEFLSELSSKAPAPGGGGASALAGAIAAALGNMVGSLTVGKKKYAGVEAEIKEAMGKASELQDCLYELIRRDAEAFEPLAACYGMKSDTEEEKKIKEEKMEKCLVNAAAVPLQIMKCCCETLDLIRIFAEKGSVMAVSDAGCGAAICKGALLSAALNVFINTKSMKNKETAEKIEKEADKMLNAYCVAADEIFASVYSSLR